MSKPQRDDCSIEITENGPYAVRGLELSRMRPSMDADGKPVEWEYYEPLDAHPDDEGVTWLCRCGQSKSKPFCDGSHASSDFDGTETAPRDGYADRAKVYEGAQLDLLDDESLCTHAGYCASKGTNAWKLAGKTDDPASRQRFESMVGHCPSGRLTTRAGAGEQEPDLPPRIGVADNGPYVVTGGVPLRGADRQDYEVRNRVSLCRCGQSSNLPFCDATHIEIEFTEKG